MGKNLSVDELLAEYNKQLDSFDANSLLEESRKAKYLEQAQAELERAERERLEREKQDQAEQMLSEQSEAGMTQAEQAENEFEDIPPFEPEQPVYEQPQPVYEQQPSVQQYPSRQVEQTVEFDSQPVQWIPQEQPQQEDAEPVISEQGTIFTQAHSAQEEYGTSDGSDDAISGQESLDHRQAEPDDDGEQVEYAQQAVGEDANDEDMQYHNSGEMQQPELADAQQDDEPDFESQAEVLGLSPEDIEMLRKKRNSRNAAAIRKLSKLKKQKSRRGENVSPKNRASLKDIKLGFTGKIIPKTEEFDKSQIPDNNTSFEERTEFLSKRRRKKVENFRLDTDEDEMFERPHEPENTKVEHDEFESFEQAKDLLSEILELKASLKRRLTILLAACVVCALLTFANDFNFMFFGFLDRTQSPAVYTVVSILLGCVAMFESYTVLHSGIKNLAKANADCDSMAALGMITAMISGVMSLFSVSSVGGKYYHIYISAAILGLVFNTIGKLMIVNRTEINFRYIAGEYDRYALKVVDNEDVAANFTQGYVQDYPVLAKMQKTEFVKDFMKNSYCTDVSDAFARRISPLILLCGLLFGILSFVFEKNPTTPVDKIITALAAFAGTVSMCSSIALILVVNLPLSAASRKYLQHSAIMLGYNAVDEFADTNAVLVEAKQLFPTGMVDFIKLKMLSTTSLEECILMAASLSCQADSILKSAFYKMLRGKTEMLYPVESYIYEDGQGLSGWIENKRILLGTRELMENHSIEGLPSRAKEEEYADGNIAVYLSISGVVTTLFVVRATASPSISGWMQELEEEGVVTVIRTVDSFLTKDFICEAFGVDESSVKFLPFRYHKDYDEQTDYAPKLSSSVICSGHFQSMAMLILGTKKLKTAADVGIAFQFGGAVMGAFLCMILSITGAFSQITASAVIGYNLLMAAVAVLISKVKKV